MLRAVNGVGTASAQTLRCLAFQDLLTEVCAARAGAWVWAGVAHRVLFEGYVEGEFLVEIVGVRLSACERGSAWLSAERQARVEGRDASDAP